MAEILDGIPSGLILDGLAEWPASTTRKEWFRLTRQLIQLPLITEMLKETMAVLEIKNIVMQ